jgi:hypothetical protein
MLFYHYTQTCVGKLGDLAFGTSNAKYGNMGISKGTTMVALCKGNILPLLRLLSTFITIYKHSSEFWNELENLSMFPL